GIERRLEPPAASENPYDAEAERLPGSLAEALDALENDETFARAFGETFTAWFLTLKRAEFARYLAYVSDWEQREYFSLL
ncbi:MAG: glnA2 2, partial [Frondihabitans sp.]|nr:glnA2 2 [Frondihabitans sp.]